MFGITLSKRRKEMANQIEADHNPKSAEFDYRRRITDDVESILRDAEVFKPRAGELSSADRYEQSALLRRLSEDITSYIIK
jgi:hypothetical protein